MARGARRAKRRLACTVIVGQQRYSGVILDVSQTGIFVQTHAKAQPREPVLAELAVPGHREPLRLETVVARMRMVPAPLITVAQGGLGLRITNAPEAYFAFLATLMPDRSTGPEVAKEAEAERREARKRSESAPHAPAPSGRRYRVYASQVGGARSRMLRLHARSSEEAAQRALTELGAGWKLLETLEDEDPR